MTLFFFRLNSYKCITDTLQELVNQSKAAPQSPSVPKKPGPPVLSSDPNMLSNEEAGHHVRDRHASVLEVGGIIPGKGSGSYSCHSTVFLPEGWGGVVSSKKAFKHANVHCCVYFSLNRCLNWLSGPRMSSSVLLFIIG